MFENRNMLVVEDEKQEIENVTKLLKEIGVNFQVAATLSEALESIAQNAFDFVLTDLHIETKAGLDSPDGLTVIKAARENQSNITVVANSSDPRAEIWNEALNAGAHHFIRKPFANSDEIVIAFSLARDRKALVAESTNSKRPTKPTGRWKNFADRYPYGIVIGEKELRIARGIARTKDAGFVITGETGTGKEEIAKLIHRLRSEKEGPVPFVAVNCASITGSLAESLLFGHRKGAFTGAEQSTTGFIGEADGGILFLDEIHTLEISTQQKLLRVLNDGTYHRLGETKVYRSQFQLLAASTRDLDEEVDAGRFLVDIRSRIMGLDLYLHPLRERKHEIPALATLFLSRKGIELDDNEFSDLIDKLQGFYWAGNIRQLFKALDAWILTCEFDDIPVTAENFPILKGMQAPSLRAPPLRESAPEMNFSRALQEDFDFDTTLAEFEKAVILSAIKRHRTIADCCKALNIGRSTLDARRRRLGLL